MSITEHKICHSSEKTLSLLYENSRVSLQACTFANQWEVSMNVGHLKPMILNVTYTLRNKIQFIVTIRAFFLFIQKIFASLVLVFRTYYLIISIVLIPLTNSFSMAYGMGIIDNTNNISIQYGHQLDWNCEYIVQSTIFTFTNNLQHILNTKCWHK